MKHKNHNGLAVAHGIDSVLTETLPRSVQAGASTPPSRGHANAGGLSNRAGSPIPSARMAEPKSSVGLTHEQIERRAYELYLARQGRDGTPLEDWFRAERELSAPSTNA